MKARFDVELSGVFEWEPLPDESDEASLFAVRELIRTQTHQALRDARSEIGRVWLHPLQVADVAFGDVDYETAAPRGNDRGISTGSNRPKGA